MDTAIKSIMYFIESWKFMDKYKTMDSAKFGNEEDAKTYEERIEFLSQLPPDEYENAKKSAIALGEIFTRINSQ